MSDTGDSERHPRDVPRSPVGRVAAADSGLILGAQGGEVDSSLRGVTSPHDGTAPGVSRLQSPVRGWSDDLLPLREVHPYPFGSGRRLWASATRGRCAGERER